jgi:hypothetical protein
MTDLPTTDPKTLVSRLASFSGEGAALRVEAGKRIEALESALAGLESMYAHTWDRVDGALVMMPPSIEKFEAAHKKAREVLGIPLIEVEDDE